MNQRERRRFALRYAAETLRAIEQVAVHEALEEDGFVDGDDDLINDTTDNVMDEISAIAARLTERAEGRRW